ncbi:hypothetical protein ABPG74_019991 [Tetrahymena malaccensis]
MINQQPEPNFFNFQQQLSMSQHSSIDESSSIFQQSNNFQANTNNRKRHSNISLQKKGVQQNSDQEFSEVQFIIKSLPTALNFQIDVYTGLQITNDGVIRHFLSLFPVYFGFNQYESFQVEDLSASYGLIKIKQYSKDKLTFSSYQHAIQFLQHIPNIQLQLAKKVFSICEINIEQINQYYAKQTPSEVIYQQKEEEFNRFQQMCTLFLQQINNQNNNLMFTYQIARLSQKQNGLDLQNYGYSKSYLDLLGINAETFSQIILRGKQIDLIGKKVDISNKSLASLQNIKTEAGDNHYSEITTFDGFQIRLYFKTKNYAHLFPNNEVLEGVSEYYFFITEIDVDMQDLNQLIQYRQRLIGNSKLTYDDFIKKELSYLFEDVEYSIHSQGFLEKYYSQNVKQLKQKQLLQCNYKDIQI